MQAMPQGMHSVISHQSRLLGTRKPHRWWLPVSACAARSFFSLLAGSSMEFSFASRTMACRSKRHQISPSAARDKQSCQDVLLSVKEASYQYTDRICLMKT